MKIQKLKFGDLPPHPWSLVRVTHHGVHIYRRRGMCVADLRHTGSGMVHGHLHEVMQRIESELGVNQRRAA